MSVDKETLVYWVGVAAALAVALAIGVRRERLKKEALRGFAARHGLRYEAGSLIGLKAPSVEGRLDGLAFFAGDVLGAKYTKIGPPEHESYFLVRLELPESVPIASAVLMDGLSSAFVAAVSSAARLPPAGYEGDDLRIEFTAGAGEEAKRWLTAERRGALKRLLKKGELSIYRHQIRCAFSDFRALSEERLEGVLAGMRAFVAEL